MRLKYFALYVFVIAGIHFYGCALSSASTRYSEINPEAEETQVTEKTRYSNSEVVEEIPDTSRNISVDEEDEYDPEPDTLTRIELGEFLQKYSSLKKDSTLGSSHTTVIEDVIIEIIRYLNTPYKYGGTSEKGIDCSAFTQNVFLSSLNIELPRSAREQFTVGEPVTNRADLKFGDLVFFNTRRRVRPGHVGIYIGDQYFAHASRSHGVVVSSMQDGYYDKRYMGARRIKEFESSFSEF